MSSYTPGRASNIKTSDVQSAANRGIDHTRDAVGSFSDTAASAAHSAVNQLGAVKDAVKDTVKDAKERAAAAARRGKEMSEDAVNYVNDNPWPFIGAALVVGVVAGLLLRRK